LVPKKSFHLLLRKGGDGDFTNVRRIFADFRCKTKIIVIPRKSVH